MSSIHAVFSNRSDDWYTPKEIYDELELRYGKKDWFDPCPLGALERGYDGLKEKWDGQFIYLNPPYSNIIDFVDKAIEYHKETNATIYFLIPSRTDTRYFDKLFKHGCEFTFIIGRLKFGGASQSSTFPSVLVELRGEGKNIMLYKHRKELGITKQKNIFDFMEEN